MAFWTLWLLALGAAFAAYPAPTAGDEASLAPIVVTEELPARVGPSEAGEFSGKSVVVDTRGESSLSRVLSRQTGVFVQRTGADDSHSGVQLRGQDPAQTRYFLEGVPLTDALFQSANLAWFPAEAIYSVDLFPEGTPAVLGADGLGGALSLRLPIVEERSFLGARLGSFGTRRAFGRLAVPSPLKAAVFLDAHVAAENFPYRDTAGTPFFPSDDRIVSRDHNAQKSITILPKIRWWQKGASYSDAFSFHTLRHSEIPGAVGLPMRGNLEANFHLLANKSLLHLTGAQSLEGLFWGWQQSQDFRASAPDLNALQISSSVTQSAGTRWTLRHEAEASFEGSVGLSTDKTRLVAGSGGVVEANKTSVPIAGALQWNIANEIRVKPAVVAQLSRLSSEFQRDSFTVSPRIGLDWAVHARQKVRASLGLFHRVPSLYELHGSATTLSANPRLQNEQAWKAEVGWDARWSSSDSIWKDVRASATLSASLAENLIALVPNSQMSFIAQNIGRSRIVSPEVGLEMRFGEGWSTRTQVAWLFTENLSRVAAYQGNALPMRPFYRGGVELDWGKGAWRITYSLQATGSMYADLANARALGSYLEHGAWASWQKAGWGVWMLEVRNMADVLSVPGQEWDFGVDQYTNGTTGFPSPGRRVYFTWRCEI